MSNGSKIATLLLILTAVSFANDKKIAVIPFESNGIDSATLLTISNSAADVILKQSKYQVIEPTQVQRSVKLNGFTKPNSCSSTECSIAIGKYLSVDQIISGYIDTIGGAYLLKIRLFDINSGRMISNSRISYKGTIEELATTAIDSSMIMLLPKSGDDEIPKFVIENFDKNPIYKKSSDAFALNTMLVTDRKLEANSNNSRSDTSGMLKAARIISGVMMVVSPIVALKFESAYQDDFQKYKERNGGSSRGYPSERKDSYRTIENVWFIGGILNGLIFIATFQF